MKANFSYSKECLVYPGEYIPLPGIEVLVGQLCKTGEESAVKPLINMDELKDCFKIEVALPGIRREDIFIHMDDNILSIIVLHKNSEVLKEKLQIHEFDTDFLERHLVLPNNADAEFVCAEYRLGMLNIYIPKNDKIPKNITGPIVVY